MENILQNLICGSLRELGLVTSVFLILQYLQAHVKFNIQRAKGIWGDREKEGSVEYLQWAHIVLIYLSIHYRHMTNVIYTAAW